MQYCPTQKNVKFTIDMEKRELRQPNRVAFPVVVIMDSQEGWEEA